jgi:hypothetical protein
MELSVLDPFGDFETRGYLRNFFHEKDLKVVARLEADDPVCEWVLP